MAKPAQLLTKAVTTYLQAKGWFVWKGGGGALKAGTRFIRWGTNGAPDLFAINWSITETRFTNVNAASRALVNNRIILLGIEIKAGKDRQSNAQKAFQEQFEVHGGKYIIVREDWKEEDFE